MRLLKLIVAALLATAVTAAAAILACDLAISGRASARIYDDAGEIPPRTVGVLLGTTKGPAAEPNVFYTERIRAAAELYKSGKIEHIIASGDHSTQYYDEPTLMRADLIASGVPEKHITVDEAGLRTLDSIVRAQRVFGQDRFTVVSQRFHVERALFIADWHGMDVQGFAAGAAPSHVRMRTRVREYFARVRAVLDIFVLGTEPATIGPTVELPLGSNQ